MHNATTNDILIWVAVRQILITYAKMISQLDTVELARLNETLATELAAVKSGGPFNEIWRQATVAAAKERGSETGEGLFAYALERLGLWPPVKEK